MFIAGDILATIGFFLGVAVTSWATLLAFKLLFPAKADRAAEAMAENAWKTALTGTLFLLAIGGAAVVLISNPLPIVKIVGMVVMGWMLAISLVGLAGLASLLAKRIDEMGAQLSPFASHSRAAAVLIGFCLLPFAGWFVFAPAVLAIGAGAGWTVVMGRAAREVRA
ncbi:hypothetical protein EON79_12315 [bacterium]|nr:MAG: hypothetical protein EON79_12315 [bacterium]